MHLTSLIQSLEFEMNDDDKGCHRFCNKGYFNLSNPTFDRQPVYAAAKERNCFSLRPSQMKEMLNPNPWSCGWWILQSNLALWSCRNSIPNWIPPQCTNMKPALLPSTHGILEAFHFFDCHFLLYQLHCFHIHHYQQLSFRNMARNVSWCRYTTTSSNRVPIGFWPKYHNSHGSWMVWSDLG